jgi:8-oxo-dGTP pyrophosphatase MutT (NUDIX family)
MQEDRETVADWRARLAAAFAGEAMPLGLARAMPAVRARGPAALPAAVGAPAAAERARLTRLGRRNEAHAILTREPDWTAEVPRFEVALLDYAALTALRRLGRRPPVVSAGAVVLCRARRTLLTQRRSRAVAHYPGRRHLFGGAFDPDRDEPAGNLRATAARELAEEARLPLPDGATPPVLLAREVPTGFVQALYLGIDVPADAAVAAGGTWEGTVESVGFDALPEALAADDWVPSGRAAVFAWLAQGAPGAGAKAAFAGLGPVQLFDRLVA